jgi:hypothetical protein
MSGRIAISRETTEVPVRKTLFETQSMLSDAGAQSINVDYDPLTKSPTAISFRLKDEYGLMYPFYLAARVKNVSKVREKARKQRIRNREAFEEQSARIAWRILKERIQSYLTGIQLGQTSVREVLLSYIQTASGKTVFESLNERRFAGLLADKERAANEAGDH